MARPRFKPTPEQRRCVETMSGYGIPEAEIAQTVGEGIDPKTLRRHFRRELDTGATKANLNVVQSLYRSATSGKCPAAAMFWMKCRAGWRETSILQHTGAQGGAVEIRHEGPENFGERIAAQLAGIAARRAQAGASEPMSEPRASGAEGTAVGLAGMAEPVGATGGGNV